MYHVLTHYDIYHSIRKRFFGAYAQLNKPVFTFLKQSVHETKGSIWKQKGINERLKYLSRHPCFGGNRNRPICETAITFMVEGR